MAPNNTGEPSTLVLYKIVSSSDDRDLYNAFSIPTTGNDGVTLSMVKKHCAALHALHPLGPDGFHWRVLVVETDLLWLDIPNDNVRLSIMSTSPLELKQLLTAPSLKSSSSSMASDAWRTARNLVTGGGADYDHETSHVRVIVFKLLDLQKLHVDQRVKDIHAASVPEAPIHTKKPTEVRKDFSSPTLSRTPTPTKPPTPDSQQDTPLMIFDMTPPTERKSPQNRHVTPTDDSDNIQALQDKAVSEYQQRQQSKQKELQQEDVIRRHLEPKIKAWSEEYGQKKQLRALLSTLDTILWAGADWKPVSMGDLLDNAQVKRCYYKASRLVHPDKTLQLDPEERFLAKRIFDALSQAKREFEKEQ